MKKVLMLTLAGMLSLGMFAFADNHGKKEEDKKPATKPATQPVNKNCAVEQEHKADPKVTFEYKGKVYAFCCEGCIDEFKKDPEKYKNAK